MKVVLKIYDKCKFQNDSKRIREESYDIEDFEVKTLPDEDVTKLGIKDFDTIKDYLILYLTNGGTLIFNNTLVDMFRF